MQCKVASLFQALLLLLLFFIESSLRQRMAHFKPELFPSMPQIIVTQMQTLLRFNSLESFHIHIFSKLV